MPSPILISTNILRDQNSNIEFIPTANSNNVFERIFYNHDRGQNCFTLIGSYGTGKSTFLWAFEQHLNGKLFFNRKLEENFQFVKFVGESISFKESFCEKFGLLNHVNSSNKVILKNFNYLLEEIQENNQGLIILVDEFGKHLEFIAKTNPDEMYFIQELCEFLNDPLRNVLFITTLHQNINAYANALTLPQIHEWEKVRGRLMEIPFDEPVEQLLFFASQKLSKRKVKLNIDSSLLFDLLNSKKAVLVKDKKHKKQLEQLFPLDPFAAEILTKSLQKYGQNERSVFGFLESDFISEFFKTETVLSVDNCFDYLVQYHFSAIEDPVRNSNKSIWQAAFSANEKIELVFPERFQEISSIIKFICLTSIFANSAAIIDKEFINNYFIATGKFNDAEVLIDLLEKTNIITFSRVKAKYVFKEATDLNLENELILANSQVNSDFNIITRLNEFVKLPVIFGKRAYFETGNPRIFRSVFKEKTDLLKFDFNFDGEVAYYFEDLDISTLAKIENISYPVILSICRKKDQIKSDLFELEKLYFIKEKFQDDKSALKIINEEIAFKIEGIRSYFELNAFNENRFNWFVNGEKTPINSANELNVTVSQLSLNSYKNAPVFKNEMVNRSVLSSPILTARKQLIKALIEHSDKKDLGFESKKFPPEKTIYLSLLKKTGIHSTTTGIYYCFQAPTDPSYHLLWEGSEVFLDSCKESRRPIAEFYDLLKGGKFKLKQGFLDFWIPIFLIIKKEDYSLYSSEGEYIPHLTPDIMDLIHKNPNRFQIKRLITEGVNLEFFHSYKELVGYNESNIKGLESSYITIYSNFLRFYRGLEEFSKNTKQLSPEAVGIRDSISKAKDPETALFELIPRALGFTSLSKLSKKNIEFLDALKLAIKEIRTAYSNLVDNLEQNVLKSLGITSSSFEEAKSKIIEKFNSIDANLISNDRVKIFYNRVMSPLDVKHAYWESLADAVLGKRLDKIQDNEIPYLIDQLKSNFNMLTDFIVLHENSKQSKEEVIQLNFLSSNGKINFKKNIVKKSDLEVKTDELKKKIELILDKDSEVNKLTLVNILTNLLKD